MRILFAVLVMGMIATCAAVLVAVQVIISLLPWLVAALVAVAALRLWERRSRGIAGTPPPPSRPAAAPWPGATARPIPPHQPVGWAMVAVPVWSEWGWPQSDAPRRHPGVIDAEVISEDEGRD
jgi:hypothetical protein